MCRKIRIKLLSWAYMSTTLSFFWQTWFKQIHPNLMKGYSQMYICAYYVWKKEEKYRILCFEARSSRGTLQQRILLYASFRAMWKLSCFHIILYFCHWKRYQHRSVSMSTCITCVLLCQIDWAREIRVSWDFSEDGAWNALELFVDGGN